MKNLSYVFKSSLLALAFVSLPHSAHGTEDVGRGGSKSKPNQQAPQPDSVFDQALPINLQDFRAEAVTQLQAVFGTIGDDGRIVFEDGYSSNGPGLMFDQARLYFIAPLPETHGASGLPFVTYYISPQGYKSIGFLSHSGEKEAISFHGFGGAIAYNSDVTQDELALKLQSLEETFPSLVFNAYSFIKIITVELADQNNPTLENAEDQRELLASLAKEEDLDYWEDQSEFFPIPYGFALPVQLGSGLEDEVVDVNALRSLSLTTGIPTTIPSWPAPFGEGRKPNPAIKGHPTLDPIDVSTGRRAD